MTPAPISLPDDDLSIFEQFDSASEPARDATSVLTVPERQAAWALANGKSCKKAAEAAGVARNTVIAWRRKPYFRAALQEAADTLLGITDPAVLNCKARVQRKTPKIGDKLVTIALTDDHPDQFRAISKALEVAGLTGSKAGHQTNVQVNVDASTELQSIHEKARQILESGE